MKSSLAAVETVRELDESVRVLQSVIEGVPERSVAKPSAPARTAPTSPPANTRATRPVASPENSGGEAAHLKPGARRILETLARQHLQRLTKAQLATLARFKVTGGTFGTYWGQVRRLGFVDERGTGRDADYTLTPAGFTYLGQSAPPEPLTTREALDSYASVLKAGARAMLEVIVAAWPEAVARDELAVNVGMTATGGAFGTHLGTLRRNGLIVVDANGARLVDHLGESLGRS